MSEFQVGDIVSIKARVTGVNVVTLNLATLDETPMGFYVVKDVATLVERPVPNRPIGSVWVDSAELKRDKPYWRIIVISEDECIVTHPHSGARPEIRHLDSFKDTSHWAEVTK
jgi:hypothetical protein